MIYEWDEAKRAANVAKHGVDFAAAQHFEWESAVQRPDLRRDYGETRWEAYGFIHGRLFTLVFTERHGRIRIISLRKSSNREHRTYEAADHL